MSWRPPVAVVPIVALALLPPVHGDSWVGPEALLDVGVQSWLIIDDIHERTVVENGSRVRVLDGVDARYVAVIKAREPGKPVTLHVLLPPGTRVLEARFYPDLKGYSPWSLISEPEVRGELESVSVRPVGTSEVTWRFLGCTWRWTQLDFEVVPGRGSGSGPYSALVLRLRIPAVHRVPSLQVYYPKHYDDGLTSLYDYGVIEWPVPAQPGFDNGFYLGSPRKDLYARVELLAWPGGVVTDSPTAPSWQTFQVRLTDHLMLVLPEARVDVVGVDLEPTMPPEEYERRRAEIVRSEWPQVTRRFGFPYVPVVAVIDVSKLEVRLEVLAPTRVKPGTEVTVFVRPRSEPEDVLELEMGTLRFALRDERGRVRELGTVSVSRAARVGGWVEFRFQAPTRPGAYDLVIEYEGPCGRARADHTLVVEGANPAGGREREAGARTVPVPVIVPPVRPRHRGSS